jgi:hypothetical protein
MQIGDQLACSAWAESVKPSIAAASSTRKPLSKCHFIGLVVDDQHATAHLVSP